MKARTATDIHDWLRSGPTLAELRARFPAEWKAVERDLARMADERDFKRLHSRITSGSITPALNGKTGAGRGDDLAAVRKRMFFLAFRRYATAAVAGGGTGKLRFGLIGGTLAQWLFFAQGFQRKPVSMRWFRLLWPWVRQKKLLMPLVETKGIYCFYSGELIQRLAELIGPRRCLEVGAGDGCLSRFLAGAGVDITATDDHSWEHLIDYPADVERLDAAKALQRHRPEVVICSWPPAGNGFERRIFSTSSVGLYIMIGSRYRTAAGNWDDYQRQRDFVFEPDGELSDLVLPPELEPAVYVFRRIPAREPGYQPVP